ncbi:MAG: hypothetical protein QM784_08950 [Polyangiaceae bacterium]
MTAGDGQYCSVGTRLDVGHWTPTTTNVATRAADQYLRVIANVAAVSLEVARPVALLPEATDAGARWGYRRRRMSAPATTAGGGECPTPPEVPECVEVPASALPPKFESSRRPLDAGLGVAMNRCALPTQY